MEVLHFSSIFAFPDVCWPVFVWSFVTVYREEQDWPKLVSLTDLSLTGCFFLQNPFKSLKVFAPLLWATCLSAAAGAGLTFLAA